MTKRVELMSSAYALTGYKKAIEANAAAVEVAPPRRRARLWELADKNHCPVVGTCLPVAELRKIARRYFSHLCPGGDYEKHVAAVNHVRTRNPASETMQRYLDTGYRNAIKAFDAAKSDDEIEAKWREFYERGEVAGALWAAVTHPLISGRVEQRILADVHMLSHQVGAGLAADNRRLQALEKENTELRVALEERKKQLFARDEALRVQVDRTVQEAKKKAVLEASIGTLHERIAYFESGQVMIEMGRKLINLQSATDELATSARFAWSLEKNLKAAHQEADRLARERDQAAAERDALLRLIERGNILSDEGADCGQVCDADCDSCPLAIEGNSVLCVGGRPSLVAQYRALAQRLGVKLIHHDGGLEESLSRVPEMIHSADAVVCPTDCVSHAAYFHIKRQCKRSGKPCLLYKGAGVSGFAVALARLSAGEFSLAGSALEESQ